MQQFTVPQFIDVEDKIIGPITVRQFLIMLSGFIVVAIFYKIFDFSLFLAASILDMMICGIFAFLRVNGRPFHFFVLNLVQSFKKPKIRVWRQSRVAEENFFREKVSVGSGRAPVKERNSSRLAELSLIVDTGGRFGGQIKDEFSTIERGGEASIF